MTCQVKTARAMSSQLQERNLMSNKLKLELKPFKKDLVSLPISGFREIFSLRRLAFVFDEKRILSLISGEYQGSSNRNSAQVPQLDHWLQRTTYSFCNG